MPRTSIFDWRLLKEQNFEKLIDLVKNFEYSGLKDQKEYKKYQYVDQIQKKLEEIKEEEVRGYFYPLHLLLRYLTNLAKLRCEDIKKRRSE